MYIANLDRAQNITTLYKYLYLWFAMKKKIKKKNRTKKSVGAAKKRCRVRFDSGDPQIITQTVETRSMRCTTIQFETRSTCVTRLIMKCTQSII